MDEVQKIYKEFKPQIMAIFMHYAIEEPPSPGCPPSEPSMDGPIWLRMMKDAKLVTRKSDVPNDLPELAAREIFMNVQMEEEDLAAVLTQLTQAGKLQVDKPDDLAEAHRVALRRLVMRGPPHHYVVDRRSVWR